MVTYYNSDTIPHAGRLIKIVGLVAGRSPRERIGRRQLADACECTDRTIARDIALLQAAHIPIDWDHARKTYFFPEGWSYPVVQLSPEDALALAFARAALVTPEVPHAGAIRRALEKTVSALDPTLRELMVGVQPPDTCRGSLAPRDYSAAPVDRLLTARAHRETIEIDYESRSGRDRSWREVDPYDISVREGGFWEMHGWCPRNRSIRTFALDRVHAVRPTDRHFTVREPEWEDFRKAEGIVGGLRGGKIIEVQVRFDPEVAPFARDHRWASTLTSTPEDDGSILLTGAVQGTQGILPEIFRYRHHAHVLGGPELLAHTREELGALFRIYETAGG